MISEYKHCNLPFKIPRAKVIFKAPGNTYHKAVNVEKHICEHTVDFHCNNSQHCPLSYDYIFSKKVKRITVLQRPQPFHFMVSYAKVTVAVGFVF